MVTTYAVMDSTNTTVVNVISPDPGVTVDPTWISLASAPAETWVGWTTPDGGTTWVAPVVTP